MGGRTAAAQRVAVLGAGALLALTGCGGAGTGTTAEPSPSGSLGARVFDPASPCAVPVDGGCDDEAVPGADETEDPAPLTPAEEAAEAAARDALRAAQGYVPPAASDLAAGEGWADGAAGAWADELPMATTVTMVRGAGPRAVERAIAGDGAVRAFPSAADAQDWVDLDWQHRRWFAVGSRNGVTFAWECFGTQGVRDDVLAPLSGDGTAAAFLVNPDDFPWSMLVARGGTVVESADSDTSDLTGRSAARRIARATGSPVLSPGWLDGPGVRFVGVQD